MSDSLWPHGLQPTRLLHPWDFLGNSTGVRCHAFHNPGIEPQSPVLRAHYLTSELPGKPFLKPGKSISKSWLMENPMCVLVTQSCLTLYDPMDYSSPGSSVHGILQVRLLEWVAIPFSRGSSLPRDWTWVSCIIAGRFWYYYLSRQESPISGKFIV